MANYRIGNKYRFNIEGIGTQTCEVIEKGYKKLKLKNSVGQVSEFDSSRLVSLKKSQTKLVKINTPKTVTKVETLTTETVDVEKLLSGTKVEDYDYVAKCIKRDLRSILIKHGYEVDFNTRVFTLLQLIHANLRNFKKE